MKDHQNSPAENVVMQADWKQMYILTEHWLSDLKFHRDEIKFLHHLTNKYVLWLTRFEHVEMVRNVGGMLKQVQTECLELLKKTEAHLKHLTFLRENPFSHDSRDLLNEHGALEQALAGFAKHFRTAKKEAFKVMENLSDSPEVVEHL